MVTIASTAEAFAIIVATLPDGYKAELNPDGGGFVVTMPNGILDRLEVLRGPRESYSDVIIRVLDADGHGPEDTQARPPDAKARFRPAPS
jgi:hypothetical protein